MRILEWLKINKQGPLTPSQAKPLEVDSGACIAPPATQPAAS